MRLRRRLRTFALLALLAVAASGGSRSARADETNAANVAAARRHFERARADYAQGAYREAIAELEAAHTLDPSAKDLVFNLGVVHEKLSDIDDALQWFQLYTTMNLTPPERDRADAYIRRLEGAKRELPRKPAPTASTSTPAPAPPPGETASLGAATPVRHGRIDAATVVAAGVAVGGLAFGTVMAIKAESDRPPAGFVTGRDGSYQDLVDATNSSHREAIFADIGFGVSLAGGITALVLYFARSPDAPTAPGTVAWGAPRVPAGSRVPHVFAAPLAGGAAVVVQGSL
jgi:tetratricopeptide (TPR) repeat protein